MSKSVWVVLAACALLTLASAARAQDVVRPGPGPYMHGLQGHPVADMTIEQQRETRGMRVGVRVWP